MHNERTPEDELAERIYQKMERIKHDPEREESFMKYELDLMDARKEGRNEQQAKDINLLIKVLKNRQFSDESIEHDLMSSYGLSHEEAQKYLG